MVPGGKVGGRLAVAVRSSAALDGEHQWHRLGAIDSSAQNALHEGDGQVLLGQLRRMRQAQRGGAQAFGIRWGQAPHQLACLVARAGEGGGQGAGQA